MHPDLFVGNLDLSVTERDLEHLFGQYGDIRRTKVIVNKATGQSRGFGFVTFATAEGAASATAALDGFDWKGRRIAVTQVRGTDSSDPAQLKAGFPGAAVAGVKELFVAGLDPRCSTDELRDLFAAHGRVLKAKVITDRETRRSKGIAFVQMSSPAENDAAIQAINGMTLRGAVVTVSEARERAEGGTRSASAPAARHSSGPRSRH